jgi:2-succinyl-6-hydroxy-2,4-cyclohexadiene-1-carboxylate synthase
VERLDQGFEDNADMPETVVLLHGFGGTGRSWDPVIVALGGGQRYRPLALDLRGHGSAASRRPATFDGCVEDVLAAAPTQFALCGYSFGGRVALHIALAAPRRVSRLVLVATTPGIEDSAARLARLAEDEELAAAIDGMDGEAFADRWQAQPIFAGTPPEAARAWREDLLRNDPAGLAAALRWMSTGAMAPMWNRLGELRMPTTVVVGETDPKFLGIAWRMVQALPDAELIVVPGAGHGLPREAPEALAAAIAG